MGIAGVAWGSVVAQYSGVLIALILLSKSYKSILTKPKLKSLFQKEPLLKFFQININIFFRTLLLMSSLAFFYSQASKAGEEILAVMVLMLQFMIWFSFVVDGFANATEALVGRYFGAKEIDKLLLAIKTSTLWSSLMAIIFGVVYYLFMEDILNLFSNDAKVIKLSLSLLPLVAILPIVSFLAFVFDGIFIGLGAVRVMRDTLFLSTTLYIGLFFILRLFLEIKVAIWGSFLLFFIFRSTFSYLIFKRYRLKIASKLTA
jgi:MATE family multidrug resistance protein